MTTPLLKVEGLRTWFPMKKGLLGRTVGQVKAVDGVSFETHPGETLGMVGESGCGKTTVGRTLLRLIPATEGKVYFDGNDVFEMEGQSLRHLRQQMQIIFQDPYSSLNPRVNVRNIVGEALVVHGIAKGRELDDRVASLMNRVGLLPEHMHRFPHEFSGGQRQRIGIARALALEPRFIVCDEAVSALDVSVQAQVVNLLEDLQDEYGLSYLFIAHDLSVVQHISRRIAVMYLGRVVEMANCDELFEQPLHPYTQALLSAIPVPKPGRKKNRIVLQGDVPNPISPPSGCHFHPRCPYATERCRTETPKSLIVDGDHEAACHLVEEGKRPPY